jgi:hypothetical protein
MNIRLTARARQDFSALPRHLKTRARKQFDFLQENLRHPSIQAKKYDASAEVWQGRVNRDYRFLFSNRGRRIRDHSHRPASKMSGELHASTGLAMLVVSRRLRQALC